MIHLNCGVFIVSSLTIPERQEPEREEYEYVTDGNLVQEVRYELESNGCDAENNVIGMSVVLVYYFSRL